MKQLIAFTAASFFSIAVNAAAVTWTLHDVQFDDGGTAIGSYDYDSESNIYSNVSITTTGVGNFPGRSYFDACAISNCPPDFIDSRPVFEYLSGTHLESIVALSLEGAMTNSGGVLEILVGGTGCELSCEFDDAIRSRTVISGSVSAVPVPAAVWLFGSAIAGLGWIKRKQAA